jgi:hypothetical protein
MRQSRPLLRGRGGIGDKRRREGEWEEVRGRCVDARSWRSIYRDRGIYRGVNPAGAATAALSPAESQDSQSIIVIILRM